MLLHVNKLCTIFVAVVLFYSPFSLAGVDSVPCEVDYVFCLSEFIILADEKPTMETIIGQLPTHVKRNLTLKRGNNIEKTINGQVVILGPHGHLAPTNESSSATPMQPRVLVWDEKSGFTASWNSGNSDHSASDRVDLYDFDFATKKHRLMAWTQAEGLLDANTVDKTGRSCVTCHGEVQRPIFPMYPDWPQFYGEFNDEMAGYGKNEQALRADLKTLSNDFQPKERALYFDFLNGEGSTNPRYTQLFDVKPDDSNPYYPYRPKTTVKPFSDVSRAFAHRPNLRIGVLYNRLTALQVFEKIKKNPLFKKFPDVLFYALLDCNWDFVAGKSQGDRSKIFNQLLKEAGALDPKLAGMNLRGVSFTEDDLKNVDKASYAKEGAIYYRSRKFDDVNYRQIPYEDLLRLLNLDIADMDIRFRHDASMKIAGKFNVYDPKAYFFTQSVMDIGYVKTSYALNPICDNSNTPCKFTYAGTYMENMKYFNSYFDGSATMNELLAAQMLIYLTDKNQDFSKEPALDAVRTMLRKSIPDPTIYFETLNKKYSSYADRLVLDKTFFTRMDTLSPWLQLPYPPDLLNVHNRESFWGSGAKTQAIRLRHSQWNDAADRTNNKPNRNGGNNICWNVFDSMKARYLK